MTSPTVNDTPLTDESENRIGAMHINPGSGPVINPSETDAADCMAHFVTALKIDGEVRWVRLPREDDRGRFGFLVYWGNRCAEIQMPGLPLAKVAYQNGLDPWQFPRLYVDGSSWLWEIAADITRKQLTGGYGE